MPLYEYECRECKDRFEVLQSIHDDESTVRCPRCNADKPKRVLSVFSSTSIKSPSAVCVPTGST